MATSRSPDELKAWIRAVLQRHVATTGQQLTFSELVSLGEASNEFLSTMLSVEARGPDGNIPLVVKLMPADPSPNYLDEWNLCRNENLVYEDFLPFLLKTASAGAGPGSFKTAEAFFPKFFHAYEDSTQCLLAIENLTPSGFKFASKVLDFPHVHLMMRELGVFHALSFIAKKRKPVEFSELAKRLCPWKEEMCQEFAMLVRGMVQYAIELFRAEYPREYETHADMLSSLEDPGNKIFELTAPEEPLAVLCHGDYNRNNVFFKYDECGKPCSLKIFDFQYAMYCSPTIDLSLVLFLSTSPDVLNRHWDELISTYHSSLLDTLEQGLCCSRNILEKEYSAEVLMKDFKKFCQHGFIITAYYMPVTIMASEDFAEYEKESPSLSSPEAISHVKRFCTSEANHRLAELVKILIERDLIS